MTKLYHGSCVIIENPTLVENQRALDFGKRFYTTINMDQAIDFAKKVMRREHSNENFISIYDFDFQKSKDQLRVLEFTEPNEDWLNFVSTNRNNIFTNDEYDLVVGPVANDKVYKVLIAFEAGIFDVEDALIKLKIQKLYNQFVFKSQSALDLLTYRGQLIYEGGTFHD